MARACRTALTWLHAGRPDLEGVPEHSPESDKPLSTMGGGVVVVRIDPGASGPIRQFLQNDGRNLKTLGAPTRLGSQSADRRLGRPGRRVELTAADAGEERLPLGGREG
jgi:hypothetical protein